MIAPQNKSGNFFMVSNRIFDFKLNEYSAKVEHPDRFELNSATAKIEQSNRRN